MQRHRAPTARRRLVRYTVPVAAAGLALTTMVGSASALHKDTFELDGNTVDDAAAGDDWSNALSGLRDFAPAGNQLANTGVVNDPAGTTIFTTGGSKDDLDVTNWRHTSGSVPDKNEITNAYASAYNTDGDLLVYFGADRYATNGNSALGFWFFQNDVTAAPDGTFTSDDVNVAAGEPIHKDGDLLVLSSFTNGGSQPTIQVYKWEPGGPVNGTLRLLLDEGSCDVIPDGDERRACAIVNSTAVQAPWDYTPKSGKSGTFGAGAFFEGGVNISDLYGSVGSNVPCFTSFLAETRSSQSVDATLKDFVGGDFNVCDADITIDGSAVNEVNDPHTFTVTVTKTVAGVTSGVEGVIPSVTLDPAPSGTQPADNGSCDEGTNTDGTCTVIFTSDTAGIIVGSASATFESGGQRFDVATGTTAETGAAIKRFVDAWIAIDPPLDTNGIGEPHTFLVTVEQDDGSGITPAPNGTTPVVTLTESNGAVIANTTDTCANPGTVNGECTVTFTSNSPGTVTGQASVSLSFNGLADPVVRETDGVAPNSGDAVKHFVDGSLTWLKVDQDDNPLGGATFEVCRTHSYDTASDTHTALASPECSSVLDNSGLDTDPTAGTLKVEGLAMGTYSVRETAAPAGYSFHPNDVKTAELETASPDATISIAFVNRELFRLIVLTCNQVTNELVGSTVTLDGDVRTTLGSSTDPTAAELCALGGANYENLTRGTYVPSVEIPAATP